MRYSSAEQNAIWFSPFFPNHKMYIKGSCSGLREASGCSKELSRAAAALGRFSSSRADISVKHLLAGGQAAMTESRCVDKTCHTSKSKGIKMLTTAWESSSGANHPCQVPRDAQSTSQKSFKWCFLVTSLPFYFYLSFCVYSFLLLLFSFGFMRLDHR